LTGIHTRNRYEIGTPVQLVLSEDILEEQTFFTGMYIPHILFYRGMGFYHMYPEKYKYKTINNKKKGVPVTCRPSLKSIYNAGWEQCPDPVVLIVKLFD
jgi:hypothetical protein